MRRVLLLVMGLVAAACAPKIQPIVIQENATLIQYDAIRTSEASATIEAQKICERFGRKAVHESTTGEDIRMASYKCIKP